MEQGGSSLAGDALVASGDRLENRHIASSDTFRPRRWGGNFSSQTLERLDEDDVSHGSERASAFRALRSLKRTAPTPRPYGRPLNAVAFLVQRL